jgi:hypothetical protein
MRRVWLHQSKAPEIKNRMAIRLGTPISGNLINCTGYQFTNLGTFSSANLRSALTDETGTGSAVFATSPALTTPVITGITNGTPPAAGKVGEIISATVGGGSPVAATNNTPLVWNSISLTAGIWIVGGSAGVIKTGGTTPTYTHMHADHGSGITDILTSPGSGSTIALHITSNHENGWIFPMGIKPYNLSATTTVNAVLLVEFTGGTCGAYGHLWGLRIA